MEWTKVLVTGADGSLKLIRSFCQVMESAKADGFRCTDEVLNVGLAEDRPSKEISCLLARSQPDLVTLCIEPDSVEKTRALLEIFRKQSEERPLLCALESAEDKALPIIVESGVTDFVVAPFHARELVLRMRRLNKKSCDHNQLINRVRINLGLKQFVGESPVLISAIEHIPRLARCDASVLITGETGTGKEMVARAIHYLSQRSGHPFIPVNCGAIPSELAENELFGHEQGAFTSANTSAHGLVHDADGGTLFLDEIDSLPLATQVKLLRFLQDKSYRPLGSRKTRQADVRLLAATNASLEEAVRAGRFRADLFYRINVLPLCMPALRDRKEDIPRLARHFADKYARELNLPKRDISEHALQKLLCHSWPGNVRELENIIQRAVALAEHPIINEMDIGLPDVPNASVMVSFKQLKANAISHFEQAYLRQVMSANQGNISQAARAARKNRRAFWQLLRKHNMQPVPQFAVMENSQQDKLRLY